MGIFYKPSDKDKLASRKKIFLDKGMPALTKRGFQKSPFTTSWFGKSSIGHSYYFCRVDNDSKLVTLRVEICRGDNCIQFHLNVFKLKPTIKNIEELTGKDGLQFSLPPNSLTEIWLLSGKIKGPPIMNYGFMSKDHKIGCYFTESGFLKRVTELGILIEKDLLNIDYYIERWHDMYKPLLTDWEGHKIEDDTDN